MGKYKNFVSSKKVKQLGSENGTLMDYLDVRDELERLMHYYEDIVHNKKDKEEISEKVEAYKASYTAVALMEACNLITKYLKTPPTVIEEDTEDEGNKEEE